MVRLRPLIAILAGVLPAVGCTQTDKYRTVLPTVVNRVSSKPATQAVPIWQRRLASLPNPLQDGMLSPGLVGQMFLITDDNKAAAADGELTVMLSDLTPRPPGQAERRPEVVQFDSVALKKLVTQDERFGPCVALFVPWPLEWTDVTTVRIQARYKQKGAVDLPIEAATISLDFSSPNTPVWTDVTGSKNGGAPGTPTPQKLIQQTMGVPDLTKLLQAGAVTTTKTEKVPMPAMQQPREVVHAQAISYAAPAPMQSLPQGSPIAPIAIPVEHALPASTQFPTMPQSQEKPVLVVPPILVAPPVLELGSVPPLPDSSSIPILRK